MALGCRELFGKSKRKLKKQREKYRKITLFYFFDVCFFPLKRSFEFVGRFLPCFAFFWGGRLRLLLADGVEVVLE